MAVTTNGFGFSAGSIARPYAGSAGATPALQFVDGRSLVADPHVELWDKGALAGISGLADGIKVAGKNFTDIMEHEQDRDLRERQFDVQRAERSADRSLAEARLHQGDDIHELQKQILQKKLDESQVPGIEAYTGNPVETAPKQVDPATQQEINQESQPITPQESANRSVLDRAMITSRSGEPAGPGSLASLLPGESPVSTDPMDKSQTITPDLSSASLVPPANPTAAAPLETPSLQENPVPADAASTPSGIRTIPIIDNDGKPTGKSMIFNTVQRKFMPGTVDDSNPSAGTGEPPAPPEGMSLAGVNIGKDGKPSYSYEKTKPAQTAKGDKLLQEQMKIVTNIKGAGDSLDEIDKKIAAMSERGPVVGPIRGKNPYDVEAQALENQVNSLVPGLARGVFGEVGVLTDEDVKRYKAMIPNIRTNPAVAQELIKDLRLKLGSTLKNNLDTWEASGYNVGNLRDELAKRSASAGGAPEIASQAEYDALPAGSKYRFNGMEGIKKK